MRVFLCFECYIKACHHFSTVHISSHNESDFNHMHTQLCTGISSSFAALCLYPKPVKAELAFLFSVPGYTENIFEWELSKFVRGIELFPLSRKGVLTGC